jgi:hypothetical protein
MYNNINYLKYYQMQYFNQYYIDSQNLINHVYKV